MENFNFWVSKICLRLCNITLNVFSRKLQASLVTVNIQLHFCFCIDFGKNFHDFSINVVSSWFYLREIFKPLQVPAASINIYFLSENGNVVERYLPAGAAFRSTQVFRHPSTFLFPLVWPPKHLFKINRLLELNYSEERLRFHPLLRFDVKCRVSPPRQRPASWSGASSGSQRWWLPGWWQTKPEKILSNRAESATF